MASDENMMMSFKNLKIAAKNFAAMMMQKGMSEDKIMDVMKKMSSMMADKDMMMEKDKKW